MYVAIQSFKAPNGQLLRMGDIISNSIYNSLKANDKKKCKKKDDGDDDSFRSKTEEEESVDQDNW